MLYLNAYQFTLITSMIEYLVRKTMLTYYDSKVYYLRDYTFLIKFDVM